MSRFLILAIITGATLSAATLPEQLGAFRRGKVIEPAITNPPLWNEYGLEFREQADYREGSKAYTLSVWKFKDPTGAYAGFQNLESQAPNWKQVGNYVYRATGDVPKESSLRNTFVSFPNLDVSSLPTLDAYLPVEGRVPRSERYILGPASLEAFDSRISPSLAAFSLGAEGQSAIYRIGGSETKVLLLSYPTPQIARKRVTDFQAVPGFVAKRTGPLIAVLLDAKDLDAAERFLSQIKYEAAVTINEPLTRKPEGNVGDMLVSIGVIVAVLIALSVLLGMAFGGFRMIRERFGMKTADKGFTSLDLSGK